MPFDSTGELGKLSHIDKSKPLLGAPRCLAMRATLFIAGLLMMDHVHEYDQANALGILLQPNLSPDLTKPCGRVRNPGAAMPRQGWGATSRGSNHMSDDRTRALNDLLLRNFKGGEVYYNLDLAIRGRPILAAVEYIFCANDPRVSYDNARHDHGIATLDGMTMTWNITYEGPPDDLATERTLMIRLVKDEKTLAERVRKLEEIEE